MLNNKLLLLGSAKPCTHIIIPFYRNQTVPAFCGWFSTKPNNGSFTPSTIKNINVLSIYSYENGVRTYISTNPTRPFNSIKLTRLDTNKSITLNPVSREYEARTGFFYREDVGKEIQLNIETQ